ncbi:MAG: hypothetical protein WC043_02885 [Pseudobdellovibrionaceae bacterium]
MEMSATGTNQIASVIPKAVSSDAKAEFGLQDRNTTRERTALIQKVQQKVTENHGFEAKEATKEALTNNTQIRNSPPQRGSLIDIAA